METLTIKTPADVLSFIGHTLGFWPHQSLVCITLSDNHVGATLRVDLPKPGTEISYAHMVAGYLAHDAAAASVLFAVYTSEAQTGQKRPHAATIAALTGALAESGMTIRDGLLVGDHTVSQYDGDPKDGIRLPLSATQSSQINAEFVYRGSTIEPTNAVTLPASTKETQTFDAVERRVLEIQGMRPGDAMDQARSLWAAMFSAASTYPDLEETIGLIANLQFPAIRDQLMADIPGIDEPMDKVLLAQTHSKPQWSRVEWAEQLLVHAYTHSATQHSAPALTAIAFINWWEGRGSKAHQFLELALEADPDYRLARLSDQMIGAGMVAGWSMDKSTAYQNRGLEAS
ncbi:DUF4192 domain-containing protein [Pseudarthrobacter sp. S6]|uniref:DUF4192 domain-containing protein n=1 Tax=Pseudarthrobacter sp. S6 TaxID=3418420 RepID=UPI003CE7AFC6